MRKLNRPVKFYPLSTLMYKLKAYTIHITNHNVILLLSRRGKKTYVAAKIIPYEWDITHVSREEILSKFEWGKPLWEIAEYSNNLYRITRVLTEAEE